MKKIALFTVVIIILMIITFVSARTFNFPPKEAGKTSTLQIPPLISSVQTLEIVSVKIVNPGSRDAIAYIDVKNNSSKPIAAVSVESGDKKDSSGIITSGFMDEPPRIIGQPFQIFTLHFPLASIVRGLPIRISGVMYIDGSAAGEEKAINDIERSKQRMDKVRNERMQ